MGSTNSSPNWAIDRKEKFGIPIKCYIPMDPYTGEIYVLDSLGVPTVVAKRELHVGVESAK